jgi:hypothetical protein
MKISEAMKRHSVMRSHLYGIHAQIIGRKPRMRVQCVWGIIYSKSIVGARAYHMGYLDREFGGCEKDYCF